MSLSIAETTTWAYDLRGEADMLEYVNCLAGPRNAWVNGAITLDDGSTITLDPQAGTYSFEFHDGKPVPETRTATMDPARHPWRTPAPPHPCSQGSTNSSYGAGPSPRPSSNTDSRRTNCPPTTRCP